MENLIVRTRRAPVCNCAPCRLRPARPGREAGAGLTVLHCVILLLVLLSASLHVFWNAYVKTSRTEARVNPGPSIGQDNDYGMKELLGLSEERYRELVEREVIY